MRFLRSLQGERPGMGSELIMPDRYGEQLAFLSPTLAIREDALLADVSFWQKEINFLRMKAAGVAGVIVRAGQRTWPDERFQENWAKAKAAGLPRGSYWFYDSREDPKKQAALWWSLVQSDPGELVHVADLEEGYGGPYWKPEHMRTFVAEFQRLSGLPDDRIAIYTGYYWWLARVGADPFFKRFALHLAWYADMSVVRIPAPWDEDDLLFWQWTSSGDGLKYGVSSLEIDLNWYCCSLVNFNQRFKLGAEPPSGGTMPTYEAVAIGDNTRLRPDHSTANPYIGSYPKGTKFHGDVPWVCPENIYDAASLLLQKQGDTWLQVIDVNGTPKAGWVAITHKGAQVCTITPPVTTPTNPPGTVTYTDVPYTYTITLGDGVVYELQTITGSGIMKVKQ